MRRAFIRASAALAAIGLAAKASAQSGQPAPAGAGKGGRVKVVYQLSEGIDQAVRAMGNLREVLVNRLNSGEVDDEALHQIVALLDEAAQKIERL